MRQLGVCYRTAWRLKHKLMQTMLGNLKTALAGTYKGFKAAKYGQRYLAEFQYRFNRRFDLATLPERFLCAPRRQSPLPERLLRTAELRR